MSTVTVKILSKYTFYYNFVTVIAAIISLVHVINKSRDILCEKPIFSKTFVYK